LNYRVMLPVFEGPLDLLLHLIKKAELDIYDIPLAEIIEQYFNYIKNIQQLDLDVASEFLIMAATLVALKAKMLLPSIPEEKEDILPDEIAEAKEELEFRLIEYNIFKSAARQLKEKEIVQSKIWVRPNDAYRITTTAYEFNPLEGVSLEDLSKTLKELIHKAKAKEDIYEIYRQEITIIDQINYISSYLCDKTQGVNFLELFPSSCTRQLIVVTFLAILELIRQQKIYAYQKIPFGEIRIHSREIMLPDSEIDF